MTTTPIKKVRAVVEKVIDLTPTAKELVLMPSEPVPFRAGSFVNLFLDKDGEKVRRAFSISSGEEDPERLSLSVRLSADGKMTPLFWNEDYTGKTVELMGPLGLNTVDKFTKKNVFLFGFGIGAGVIRAMALALLARHDIESLTIMTGSRNEHDMVHKSDFDALAAHDPRVKVVYVISSPESAAAYPRGYIQEHIEGLDFNNADIYICGQEAACDDLVGVIEETSPQNCNFFVEGFH